MTNTLQSLINTAEQLSPVEQVELISAVSLFLQRHYQQEASPLGFWNAQPFEQILKSQSAPYVTEVSDLKADFWPTDESASDVISYVEQRRAESCIKLV